MKYRLVLVLISLTAFGIAISARNSYAGSDPKFTLLVSQSIIDNGTIQLDAYEDDLLLNQSVEEHLASGLIIEEDGHLYNYFPAGPSVLSVPIVALARISGLDMRLVSDNFLIQEVMAASTVVLLVWIVYGISRCYVNQRTSLLIVAVSVLGTGIISSIGTALWTINFSTLFIALSVLLLTRYDSGKSKTVHPFVFGLLLFLAFFVRPSSSAFIISALAYLLVKERRQFFITAATASFLLLLFLVWSRLEFDSWLPSYYSVRRIQVEREPLWIGLIGNLLSPSRGIFIFSPFFLLIVPGLLVAGRRIFRRPIVWMAASWFGLSLLLTARAASWWGGVSFGPRLMTENLLALILLLVLAWNELGQRLSQRTQITAAVAFLLLGALAIFIHSYQGLYNPNTVGWNQFVEPIARPPLSGLGDHYDWSNPQFLATAQGNCDFAYQRFRELLPYDTTLEAYHLGDPIRYTADQFQDFRQATIREAEARQTPSPTPATRSFLPAADVRAFLPLIIKGGNRSLFYGWQEIREDLDHRKSICQETYVVFRLGQVETSRSFELALLVGTKREQEVQVFVNGVKAGAFVSNQPAVEPGFFTIAFDGDLLETGQLNEIALKMPGARPSVSEAWVNDDLALYWLAIYPSESKPAWVLTPLPTPSPQQYP